MGRSRSFCLACACVCGCAPVTLLLSSCLDRNVAFLDGDDAGAATSTTTTSASADSGGAATGTGDTCGSNTARVVAAAQAFLASLNDAPGSGSTPDANAGDGGAGADGGDAGVSALLALANLPFTEIAAERWTSLPSGVRNGPDFAQLSAAQQDLALSLARAALSAEGFDELQNIRAADDVLASTVASDGGAAVGWGSELTHVAILGTPSTSAVWMLQISLHQLVYNIVYNGKQASGTPVFLGTEPTNWTLLADGGTLVTGLENGATTSFVNGVQTAGAVSGTGGTAFAALEPQRVAVQSLLGVLLADATNGPAAKLAGTFADVSTSSNDPLVYPTGTTGRGVLYSSLSAAEKAATLATIEAWADTQACDIRDVLLAAYESDAALASTYVGYGVPLGADQPSFASDPDRAAAALDYLGSYLRIDGPRVWIEMVVVEAAGYRDQGWVQYHSLWRDKVADHGGEFTGTTVE